MSETLPLRKRRRLSWVGIVALILVAGFLVDALFFLSLVIPTIPGDACDIACGPLNVIWGDLVALMLIPLWLASAA